MKFKSVEEITEAIKPTADSMDIEIVEVEVKITKMISNDENINKLIDQYIQEEHDYNS